MARDISEDINTFNIVENNEMIDVTGVDKFARERLTGLADAELSISGPFDTGTNKAHDVFKDKSNPREFVLTWADMTEYTLTAVIESYNVTRGDNGAMTYQVTARQADGTTGQWS
jgi:hypothetical protein